MTPLVLTEDQAMLADNARQVVDERAPVGLLRSLRDAGRTFDASLWAELAELGWAGLAVPEARGGLGLGLPEAAVVLEALGRNLVPTPMISAVMTGPLVDGVAEGRVVALAWRAEVTVTDGRLTGAARGVLDGGAAQAFVVVAGDALWEVDAAAASVTALVAADHRDVAHVRLENAPGRQVGDADALAAALERGRVALCAEMLGGVTSALERTLAWLHERHQFGVPIGSFQVLQHRAVDMFVGVELARSAVMAAAREPSAELVSLAKARCSDTYLKVTEEAVQMHGGIGMTDEHDIGLYLKRALVSSMTLGTSGWHRDRWARLHGY